LSSRVRGKQQPLPRRRGERGPTTSLAHFSYASAPSWCPPTCLGTRSEKPEDKNRFVSRPVYPFTRRCERAQAQVREATTGRPRPPHRGVNVGRKTRGLAFGGCRARIKMRGGGFPIMGIPDPFSSPIAHGAGSTNGAFAPRGPTAARSRQRRIYSLIGQAALEAGARPPGGITRCVSTTKAGAREGDDIPMSVFGGALVARTRRE
jgi:hypothetical protein